MMNELGFNCWVDVIGSELRVGSDRGLDQQLVTGLVEGTIGVNYGTLANNLPPPPRVAKFLKESKVINHVRLFDVNPEFLRAFAHTGIAVTVTVPNSGSNPIEFCSTMGGRLYPTSHTSYQYSPCVCRQRSDIDSRQVVNCKSCSSHAKPPNSPGCSFVRWSNPGLDVSLFRHSLEFDPTVHRKISTRLRAYDTHVLKSLLSFLRDAKSPFMVNPYPFFDCSPDTLDYALFRPNAGVFDENTELLYTNMLDAQLDAVYSAMKLLGFDDLEIVIAETGWPSMGDPVQVGVDAESAAEYNSNFMRHVTSGVGTPLMLIRTFETYIFVLFDEDLKPGSTCERHFGLFRPDLTPASETRDDAFVTTATPVPTTARSHQMPIYDRKLRLCLPKMSSDEKWFAMEYRALVQLAFSHP
ncbi:Glucan endo-1,3-beta-glucosidase 7 [Hibiscus syriacus]|uniref:glucan endo-1,3-beta-D-glucosidase n=1 Tax=Hibiscus syriacus TaxID=106335 RepID=A0A6A2YFL6_HIBSY|nr:Glucan endo-1,3-beta-glucosidase 7 [Hibiscus syriacus]